MNALLWKTKNVTRKVLQDGDTSSSNCLWRRLFNVLKKEEVKELSIGLCLSWLVIFFSHGPRWFLRHLVLPQTSYRCMPLVMWCPLIYSSKQQNWKNTHHPKNELNCTLWQISNGKLWKIFLVKMQAESAWIAQNIPKYSRGFTEVRQSILLKYCGQKLFQL